MLIVRYGKYLYCIGIISKVKLCRLKSACSQFCFKVCYTYFNTCSFLTLYDCMIKVDFQGKIMAGCGIVFIDFFSLDNIDFLYYNDDIFLISLLTFYTKHQKENSFAPNSESGKSDHNYHFFNHFLLLLKGTQLNKSKFRFEPKQTETRSVSRLFRFVS